MNLKELAAFNEEHMKMLTDNAADNFMVKHYVSIADLKLKEHEE